MVKKIGIVGATGSGKSTLIKLLLRLYKISKGSIEIDNKSDLSPKGVSPMELLLMGVAGCSSIDIISILKKQKQNFDNLYIEVEGKREGKELPSLFTEIHAKVFIEGNVDSKKA